MTSFSVNGRPVTVDVDPDTPLLWVLRDELKLTGTKFGCGIAQCGACTVHLDGLPRRSCVTPIASVEGGKVTTIEGISGKEADAVTTRLDRNRCASVRLLSVGTDHDGCLAALRDPETDRRRHRRRHGGQRLPLCNLCAHSCRDPSRGRIAGSVIMRRLSKLEQSLLVAQFFSRRDFLRTAGAAGPA